MLQVMVTDWNPLMVWFYDECYLRFSMANFSMENLEDNFTHLCNNSIQKEQENFENVKDKSMWDLEAFRAHLAASHPNGDDLWTNKILPQMQNISKWALMCAQDMLENRKNSSEVYGYDFMLDADFNIWLLEVNASPDMSASTAVTERLTSRVMDDMIKVMVDAREFNWGRKKNDKTCDVDTGGWQLVHRGEAEVSCPVCRSLPFSLWLSVPGTRTLASPLGAGVLRLVSLHLARAYTRRDACAHARLCAHNACAHTHAYTREHAQARETKIFGDVAQVSFPISAFGCKLALTGSGMEIPKVFTGGAPTYDKRGSKRETRADKLREEQKKKEEEKLKVTVCV
jgi:hypothetical protein